MSTLSINALRLYLYIGCSESERAYRQAVDIDVTFFFNAPPLGCQTDHLDNTLCYADAVAVIKKTCYDQSFHLIEHLAYVIYNALYKDTGPRLQVKVTKCHPPVEGVMGGVSFTYVP